MVKTLIVVAAVGIIAGILDTRPLPAQTQVADAARKFEVAAIKPNKSGDGPNRINVQPGGRFTATNVPLRSLIRTAYQLQDFQLVGGPDWIASERYDIVAKAESDIPMTPPGAVGPLQLMMRSLLEERFKLAVHQEKRELPIYGLIVAKPDGRLGSQLHPSTVDCQAMMTAARGRGVAPQPPPSAPSGRPVCGMRTSAGQIMAGGFPLSQLAAALAQMVQRVVVDRTGLIGNFDLELTFTPDQMPQGPQGTPPPGAPPLPPIDASGASIFTALQEQLGLKLDSQRGPVDVLVIDRAERPTEN